MHILCFLSKQKNKVLLPKVVVQKQSNPSHLDCLHSTLLSSQRRKLKAFKKWQYRGCIYQRPERVIWAFGLQLNQGNINLIWNSPRFRLCNTELIQIHKFHLFNSVKKGVGCFNPQHYSALISITDSSKTGFVLEQFILPNKQEKALTWYNLFIHRSGFATHTVSQKTCAFCRVDYTDTSPLNFMESCWGLGFFPFIPFYL